MPLLRRASTGLLTSQPAVTTTSGVAFKRFTRVPGPGLAQVATREGTNLLLLFPWAWGSTYQRQSRFQGERVGGWGLREGALDMGKGHPGDKGSAGCGGEGGSDTTRGRGVLRKLCAAPKITTRRAC